MSLQYRLLYRLGITPWEQMAELPVRDQLVGLLEREEQNGTERQVLNAKVAEDARLSERESGPRPTQGQP